MWRTSPPLFSSRCWSESHWLKFSWRYGFIFGQWIGLLTRNCIVNYELMNQILKMNPYTSSFQQSLWRRRFDLTLTTVRTPISISAFMARAASWSWRKRLLVCKLLDFYLWNSSFCLAPTSRNWHAQHSVWLLFQNRKWRALPKVMQNIFTNISVSLL